MLGADRSAGQDSLETVADFRARNLADGTNSSSAFIQVTTPRLNSGRQSAKLNHTTQNNTENSLRGHDDSQQ